MAWRRRSSAPHPNERTLSGPRFQLPHTSLATTPSASFLIYYYLLLSGTATSNQRGCCSSHSCGFPARSPSHNGRLVLSLALPLSSFSSFLQSISSSSHLSRVSRCTLLYYDQLGPSTGQFPPSFLEGFDRQSYSESSSRFPGYESVRSYRPGNLFTAKQLVVNLAHIP